MMCLDGATICADRKAKGGSRAERDRREALDRCGGGKLLLRRQGTTARVISDGARRAIAVQVALGQAHKLSHGIPMLDRLPACRSGCWVTAATPVIASAGASRTWAQNQPFQANSMRHP